MNKRPATLRPSRGYRRLPSFQVTEIIYDGTVAFCQRFVDKRSRTHDQMVQAARSGRQNIAEGSRASATSSQTELRLVNVARASLDELLPGAADQSVRPDRSVGQKTHLRGLRKGDGVAHSSQGNPGRLAVLGLLGLSRMY